ncbi:MAG: hypothetical protein LBP85_01205 [Prevotellaceae bacterium]|jgi:hypothetical protein|nr:hypothetical protein [Prevotellaceae bacterium]
MNFNKKTLFLLALLLCSILLHAQNEPLTQDQKIADFEYLYQVLKENYPFFGVAQRQYGIDWLSKKEEYLARIKSTPTDSAYIFTLKSVLDDLHCGHVNFNCTRWADEGYSSGYHEIAEKNGRYVKWAEMFDNPKTRTKYWTEILKKGESNIHSDNETASQKPISDYFDTVIADKKIAVMTVRTFNHFRIEPDREKINALLNKINECEALIINIHDNSGGSDGYWKNNIVSRLIHSPATYIMYPVIKDGEINRYFYPEYFSEGQRLQKSGNLQNIPPELLSEKYYVYEDKDTIYPNNPAVFRGKIYLLVSKNVFSASETFAQFCKTTNWATIAGEQTGGDGIGSDSVIVLLPESGILVCYPALTGLNHSGGLNFEERTVPDITVSGNNAGERIDNLIKIILQKQI